MYLYQNDEWKKGITFKKYLYILLILISILFIILWLYQFRDSFSKGVYVGALTGGIVLLIFSIFRYIKNFDLFLLYKIFKKISDGVRGSEITDNIDSMLYWSDSNGKKHVLKPDENNPLKNEIALNLYWTKFILHLESGDIKDSYKFLKLVLNYKDNPKIVGVVSIPIFPIEICSQKINNKPLLSYCFGNKKGETVKKLRDLLIEEGCSLTKKEMDELNLDKNMMKTYFKEFKKYSKK